MTLADLREQTNVELDSLDMVNATLLKIVRQSEGRAATDIERAAVFSLLIQLYSGFEHIFKRICKFYLVPIPAGDDSHQQLMSRFIASSSEREYPTLPILVPESLRTPLTTLRRFRHAAVHGYSHRFDEERLMIAAGEAPNLYTVFKKEVESFLSAL